MREPPRILIVDDNPVNVDILRTRLSTQGYDIVTGSDGEQAIRLASEHFPDLVLLDIMMPKLNGVQVCRELKSNRSLPFIPVILVTAMTDTKDVVAGLDAGADEYLTKPVDQHALVARVKSMLRIKDLHDKTRGQAAQLAKRSAELKELNDTLKERVNQQVQQIERLGRLQRFFSPAVAEKIISSGEERLESHRQEIAAVCCDLRSFTAFAEVARPEETIALLRGYHETVGALAIEFDGTIEHFSGDGIMLFLNDPIPCERPAETAVELAVSMRSRVGTFLTEWKSRGHDLGFGVGVSVGYATIGLVGFESRYEYAAIGPALNLAARLCDRAEDNQILISQPVREELGSLFPLQFIGEIDFKGIRQKVPTYNVTSTE